MYPIYTGIYVYVFSGGGFGDLNGGKGTYMSKPYLKEKNQLFILQITVQTIFQHYDVF